MESFYDAINLAKMKISAHTQEDGSESLSYFAYGSNMSVVRLQSRVPSAVPIGVFKLLGHQLIFHKIGRDFSAKCDAMLTEAKNDYVYGVLYTIARKEKIFLDQAEGLGNGYEEKNVNVVAENGDLQKAFMYFATTIDPSLKPFSWYKYHVLQGATEARLPVEYTNQILSVPDIKDPEPLRTLKELQIYENTTS
jgi:gamma-glutamylcyclotransferase